MQQPQTLTVHTHSTLLDECVGMCVAPERAAELWPHVEGYFAKAAEYGDVPLSELKSDVEENGGLLWVVWDGREIIAGVITVLEVGRLGTACLLKACGGKDMESWLPLLENIEQYAILEGCVKMKATGRKGWARVLGDYELTRVVLEKKLRLVN